MTKVSTYDNDETVDFSDRLFGTNQSGKNKNYEIKEIIALINSVAGKDYIQYEFSLTNYSNIGGFTTNSSKTNPAEVTKLFLNKQSATKKDLTVLFTKLDTLQNIVIELRNPSDANNFATFKITNITSHTSYFEFDVVLYKSFSSGLLTAGATYSAYFDVKENFEDKLGQGNYVGTAETLKTDIETRVVKVTGSSLVPDAEITKLSHLDDTADIDKPVSTAQQTAIDSAVQAQISDSTALLDPTIPIVPTGNVHILGVGPGTYSNWGGMVIPDNNTGTLRRVDGVFSVSLTPVPDLVDYAKKVDVISKTNIDSRKYIYVIADAEGKILFGIKKDGQISSFTNQDIYNEISKLNTKIEEVRTEADNKTLNDYPLLTLLSNLPLPPESEQTEGYFEIKKDANGNVIETLSDEGIRFTRGLAFLGDDGNVYQLKVIGGILSAQLITV